MAAPSRIRQRRRPDSTCATSVATALANEVTAPSSTHRASGVADAPLSSSPRGPTSTGTAISTVRGDYVDYASTTAGVRRRERGASAYRPTATPTCSRARDDALYRNDGGGTFTDVTSNRGIAGDRQGARVARPTSTATAISTCTSRTTPRSTSCGATTSCRDGPSSSSKSPRCEGVDVQDGEGRSESCMGAASATSTATVDSTCSPSIWQRVQHAVAPRAASSRRSYARGSRRRPAAGRVRERSSSTWTTTATSTSRWRTATCSTTCELLDARHDLSRAREPLLRTTAPAASSPARDGAGAWFGEPNVGRGLAAATSTTTAISTWSSPTITARRTCSATSAAAPVHGSASSCAARGRIATRSVRRCS